MKLIVDIPNYSLDEVQNGSIASGQILKAVKNGIPYEEGSQGDLISRSYLRQMIPTPIEDEYKYVHQIINNAPAVETDIEVVAKDAYEQGYTDGWKERYGEPDERPQGEWIDTGSGQECNVCHEIQYGYDNFRHFCANCGAK